jgi:two-component system NtrC family sensor kinase
MFEFISSKFKNTVPGREKDRTDSEKKASSPSRESTGTYYRRLRRRLYVWVLIAYLVPLLILGIYFQFQFNFTLKESGKLHLINLAESQRNIIDLFLQERIVNIYNLFHGTDFRLSPSPEEMRRYLERLRGMNDSFVDVGFLDNRGMQIGYAGPYPYLQGRDYSGENWFQKLFKTDQQYYISDIYYGFRRIPHFTIAVKQIFDGKPYVMRATLDPDKFYMFLRTIGKERSENSSLINDKGIYQLVDPYRGELLGQSDYVPPRRPLSGTKEIDIDGSTVLVAYIWLKEVPWVLLIREPLEIAYAHMYRVRKIIVLSTSGLLILIITAIILTTERLLRQAQRVQESRKELQSQLFHASKLVAVGELAAGVAHEINNPLAIIAASSGVIRDMIDPNIPMADSPEEIEKELNQIDSAVYRARDITQQMLTLVRKTKPQLVPTKINKLLDEIVDGVKMKEFQVSNIEVIKDFDPDLPEILIDQDQMRQVFLNIINNAGDAIKGGGSITLKTQYNNGEIHVTILDTGAGMNLEEMGKIFIPFYTSKEVGRGTGLGLSISLSIVQSMSGRIEVQSVPDGGSSFTVVLPVNRFEDSTSI